MKVYINGFDLANAVNKVSRALPNRNVNEVLEMIKFKAMGSHVYLFATNMEISIEVVVPAVVEEEGCTLVPGKIFTDYIKMIASDENIKIETVNNDSSINDRMIVNTDCGRESFFRCMDITLFPNIEVFNVNNNIKVKSSNLKDLLNKVSFSMLTTEGANFLKGVKIISENNTLVSMATDRMRSSDCTRAAESIDKDISIIIPAQSVAELSKLINNDDEILSLDIGENNIIIKIGDTTLTSRLIANENNKDYRTFYKEKEMQQAFSVDREKLLNSINTVCILSEKTEQLYKVKLNITENKMTIFVKGNIGEAKEELPIKLIGEDVQVIYNAKYMIESLKAIDSEYVTIRLNDSLSCLISDGENELEKHFIARILG